MPLLALDPVKNFQILFSRRFLLNNFLIIHHYRFFLWGRVLCFLRRRIILPLRVRLLLDWLFRRRIVGFLRRVVTGLLLEVFLWSGFILERLI